MSVVFFRGHYGIDQDDLSKFPNCDPREYIATLLPSMQKKRPIKDRARGLLRHSGSMQHVRKKQLETMILYPNSFEFHIFDTTSALMRNNGTEPISKGWIDLCIFIFGEIV